MTASTYTDTAIDTVLDYVTYHNKGVRTGDFTSLYKLFADNIKASFANSSFGPFNGKQSLIEAFGQKPPSQELVIMNVEVIPQGANITYSWSTEREKAVGSFSLTISNGLIYELKVKS
jgi:hypothetical protein